MGGAVSSGESNDDLIDNLIDSDYIKTSLVERVFRGVDRAFYYTNPYKQNAYQDLAWKDGNLHLSAPCIYSEVLENIKIEEGMSFLNIGSGTGYLSTMIGLILGRRGINHGIELYEDVVEYSRMKLDEFLQSSSAIDVFDFCEPQFVVGNCLEVTAYQKRYDRIYCGAACPENSVQVIVDLLKVGGVCIVPINDSLVHITRISDSRIEMKALLPVSFASLIIPKPSKTSVLLPEVNPMRLEDLCRAEIRSILRKTIQLPEIRHKSEAGRQRRRRKRQERRRASRLLVVQRRRSGEEPDGDQNGFVAIAYSMGTNTRNGSRNTSRNTVDSDDEIVPVQSRDHDMNESADDEEDYSDMPVLHNESKIETENDKYPHEPLEPLPSTSDNSVEPNSLNGCFEQKEETSCSSHAVASASQKSQTQSTSKQVPPDSLPKIRPAPRRQRGSKSPTETNRGFQLYNLSKAQQNHRSRPSWATKEKIIRLSTKKVKSVNSRVSPVDSNSASTEEGSGVNDDNVNSDDMVLSPELTSASSSEELHEDCDLQTDGAPMTVGDAALNAMTDAPSNSTRAHVRGCNLSTCDDDISEDSIFSDISEEDELPDNSNGAKESNPFNAYSIQMCDKIKSLPLPPAVKVYLNYNRKF